MIVGLTEKQKHKLKLAKGTHLSWEDEYEIEFNILPTIRKLIQVCGDDPERDGLKDSPYRFTKAMLEYTQGYHELPEEHLDVQFDGDGHEEIVLVKDIPFHSLCEHHFAPFYGKAHIAYIPANGKITGLSKFGRLLDGYAKRFQVQERLTSQIADAINTVLQPQGVMVIIEATHMCMCGRGVKKAGSSTTTSAVRGCFKDETSARQEVLSLLK